VLTTAALRRLAMIERLALALAPMVLLVAALLIAERRKGAVPGDWWLNLLCWALGLGAGLLVLPHFLRWTGPALIDGASLPFLVALPLYLGVRDLGEFLFHRAQHRIPLLWAMHSLHHSDPQMNVLTTQRHFWADQLLKSCTVWAAAAMIVSPTPALLLAYAVASLWNFFAHADLAVSFGRWSWLINAPAYHRRHHSRLPEHYDSNFAALLPIFDVIAGTYHRPDGFPPTGLERAPKNLAELVAWPMVWRSSEPAEAEPQAASAS
jgi:sterol desaturase/sphingolipid hydroxylase (fatty acid hydroxylase superfamily)